MKIAYAGICLLIAAVCHAQEQPAVQPAPDVTPAAEPASAVSDLMGLRTFGQTLAAAVSDQIRRFPEQWGHGATHGFGTRAASEYGQVAMENLIQSGVQRLHKEDPRYFRRGQGNFFARTFHVIENTVLVHSTSGGRTVSLALPAEAYGSWAIGARWYPASQQGLADFFKWGSSNAGLKFAGNFAREFWPDVKGFLRGN